MNPEKRVADLMAELEQAEAAARELRSLPPARRIALELHRVLCRANHIDHCSWDFEDWNGETHRKYIRAAETILANTSGVEAALAVVYALELL